MILAFQGGNSNIDLTSDTIIRRCMAKGPYQVGANSFFYYELLQIINSYTKADNKVGASYKEFLSSIFIFKKFYEFL